MAAWQPTQEGLNQIIQLLQFSQSPDHDVQKQVNQVTSAISPSPSQSLLYAPPPPLFFWRACAAPATREILGSSLTRRLHVIFGINQNKNNANGKT
jgi:hypothetical protein